MMEKIVHTGTGGDLTFKLNPDRPFGAVISLQYRRAVHDFSVNRQRNYGHIKQYDDRDIALTQGEASLKTETYLPGCPYAGRR